MLTGLVLLGIGTAGGVATGIISSAREHRADRREVKARRHVIEARQEVDAVFRNARRAMDDLSGIRERRPFGIWEEWL
jgi:hypothetical protein